MINSTTNGNGLMFNASLSDNGTDYYCTASVGPANTVNGFELIMPSDAVTTASTTVIVDSKLLTLMLHLCILYNVFLCCFV